MKPRTPTQEGSKELADAVVDDCGLCAHFEQMAADTSTREPVRDDFAWLPPDVRTA